MQQPDIFRGAGVEVSLPHPDNFLKVKETLTRMGVASQKEKRLYQSCHILHKQGRYVILHFKELFRLDGKGTTFSEEDEGRRNTITNLLGEWSLVTVLDINKCAAPRVPITSVKIVSFREKVSWILESKYDVGRKKEVLR